MTRPKPPGSDPGAAGGQPAAPGRVRADPARGHQLARIGSSRRVLPDGTLCASDSSIASSAFARRTSAVPEACGFPNPPRGSRDFHGRARRPRASSFQVPDRAARRDGEEHPRGSPRRTRRAGTPVRVYGTAQDVTERLAEVESLRKSELLLQTVFDAEPECVKLLDEDAKLILMNRAGLDMLEAESLDQVKGECVCPLVTSEYRQPFLELTKRVFRGESGILLFEMVGLKGRRLWLETHAVPLRNERGETTAVLGVTRDVAESRRTEEALRSSEARFRTIIESASVGILLADAGSGKFRYANPEICRLLGYTAEEFLALEMRDLPAQEELQDAAAGFRLTPAGGCTPRRGPSSARTARRSG